MCKVEISNTSKDLCKLYKKWKSTVIPTWGKVNNRNAIKEECNKRNVSLGKLKIKSVILRWAVLMSRERELSDFFMLPYHDIQCRILGNYYIDENKILVTHGVKGVRSAK